MSQTHDDLPELGSLGQSARSKHLKSAKVTMILVGILTIGANAFLAGMAEKLVDDAFKKELQNIPAEQIDAVKLQELKQQAITTTKLVSIGFCVVGVVYLVLGFMVYRAPVATTATALVLYIAGWAVTGLMDPAMLLKGIILKIIIIGLLVRALKAAIEYQKESAGVEAV
jgi:hypothetical protein